MQVGKAEIATTLALLCSTVAKVWSAAELCIQNLTTAGFLKNGAN